MKPRKKHIIYKEENFEYISHKPASWFNDEVPTQVGKTKAGKWVDLGRMRFNGNRWVGKYKPKNSKEKK